MLSGFHLHSKFLFLSSHFSNQGEGNGNPLQYSCLENAVDRGAWWAAVHRVAQSQTRLKRFSSSSSIFKINYNIVVANLDGEGDETFTKRPCSWAALTKKPRAIHRSVLS